MQKVCLQSNRASASRLLPAPSVLAGNLRASLLLILHTTPPAHRTLESRRSLAFQHVSAYYSIH